MHSLANADELLASIPQISMEMHGYDDPKIVEVLRKLRRHFYLVNLHFNNWSCTTKAAPLPAWAYQTHWVNKRIGVLDPTVPVPRDHHSWYSHRLGREGVGADNVALPGTPHPRFPAPVWASEPAPEVPGHGLHAFSPYLDQGRMRIFCINGVQSDSFANKGAHPFHRSWMQAQYGPRLCGKRSDFPSSTPCAGHPRHPNRRSAHRSVLIPTRPPNTLFKHPDHVKRCYALSGIYDMRDSMDGMSDEYDFYFNNPVDYMANQHDPWFLHQYASCDIRLVTGTGPWENSGPTYRMSEILRNRGIAHHLDDSSPEERHEWPYWHHIDVGIRGRALKNH